MHSSGTNQCPTLCSIIDSRERGLIGNWQIFFSVARAVSVAWLTPSPLKSASNRKSENRRECLEYQTKNLVACALSIEYTWTIDKNLVAAKMRTLFS